MWTVDVPERSRGKRSLASDACASQPRRLMAEAVKQGWKWLTGNAPRPDRRSTMVLGVGTATAVVLVLGLSLIASGPTRSALSRQRSAAQPSGSVTLAPTGTTLPGAGSLATTSSRQVAPLPATTTSTTSTTRAKGAAAKTAHSRLTRRGPKAHRRTKRHRHARHRAMTGRRTPLERSPVTLSGTSRAMSRATVQG